MSSLSCSAGKNVISAVACTDCDSRAYADIAQPAPAIASSSSSKSLQQQNKSSSSSSLTSGVASAAMFRALSRSRNPMLIEAANKYLRRATAMLQLLRDGSGGAGVAKGASVGNLDVTVVESAVYAVRAVAQCDDSVVVDSFFAACGEFCCVEALPICIATCVDLALAVLDVVAAFVEVPACLSSSTSGAGKMLVAHARERFTLPIRTALFNAALSNDDVIASRALQVLTSVIAIRQPTEARRTIVTTAVLPRGQVAVVSARSIVRRFVQIRPAQQIACLDGVVALLLAMRSECVYCSSVLDGLLATGLLFLAQVATGSGESIVQLARVVRDLAGLEKRGGVLPNVAGVLWGANTAIQATLCTTDSCVVEVFTLLEPFVTFDAMVECLVMLATTTSTTSSTCSTAGTDFVKAQLFRLACRMARDRTTSPESYLDVFNDVVGWLCDGTSVDSYAEFLLHRLATSDNNSNSNDADDVEGMRVRYYVVLRCIVHAMLQHVAPTSFHPTRPLWRSLTCIVSACVKLLQPVAHVLRGEGNSDLVAFAVLVSQCASSIVMSTSATIPRSVFRDPEHATQSLLCLQQLASMLREVSAVSPSGAPSAVPNAFITIVSAWCSELLTPSLASTDASTVAHDLAMHQQYSRDPVRFAMALRLLLTCASLPDIRLLTIRTLRDELLPMWFAFSERQATSGESLSGAASLLLALPEDVTVMFAPEYQLPRHDASDDDLLSRMDSDRDVLHTTLHLRERLTPQCCTPAVYFRAQLPRSPRSHRRPLLVTVDVCSVPLEASALRVEIALLTVDRKPLAGAAVASPRRFDALSTARAFTYMRPALSQHAPHIVAFTRETDQEGTAAAMTTTYCCAVEVVTPIDVRKIVFQCCVDITIACTGLESVSVPVRTTDAAVFLFDE